MERVCFITQEGWEGLLVIGFLWVMQNDGHCMKEHHSVYMTHVLLQCCTGRPLAVFYILGSSALYNLIILCV